MRDRGYVVLLVVVISGLTVALIAGHGPWSGREVLRLSSDHGVNTGDLVVLAAWIVAMACCWRLWRGGAGR